MATFNTPRCSSTISAVSTTPFDCDYHRSHFCKKYGPQFPKICPTSQRKSQNTCESIHDCLKALDYFSCPSPFPPKYSGRNRYMNYCKPHPCLLYGELELLSKAKDSSRCARIPQLPPNYKSDPRPYGDAVYGLCEELNVCAKSKDSRKISSTERFCVQQPQLSFDLPFTVSLMDTSPPNPADEISPAVDYKSRVEKRRSMRPLAICPDLEKKDLILAPNEPICVNATPVKWKRTTVIKGGKNFEICIPGPIIIG